MQGYLIILALVSVAHAGVRKLSPQQEQQVLQQFVSLCLSGSVSELGEEVDGVQIYCKITNRRIQQESTHEEEADFGRSRDQSVFIRPPPIDLTHRVVVTGKHEGGHTNVYVVPGEVTNRYNVNVDAESRRPQKTTIFYLNNPPNIREERELHADSDPELPTSVYDGQEEVDSQNHSKKRSIDYLPQKPGRRSQKNGNENKPVLIIKRN